MAKGEETIHKKEIQAEQIFEEEMEKEIESSIKGLSSDEKLQGKKAKSPGLVEELSKKEDLEKEDLSQKEARQRLEKWVPKTSLGKEVLNGKIKSIDEILDSGRKIMEPEIVDMLLPNLKIDILFIGQAKGKFGGGKRRAFRQTQKKTEEANVLTFEVMAVVGDENGHVGIGYGEASETLPAKEKAIRKAKLNIVRINRGCASYDCSCNEPHSIPVTTYGKCSSVRLKLIPAPQGTGLVVNDELKKILRLAGIKDIYSQSFGEVRTTINSAKACIQALTKISELRL